MRKHKPIRSTRAAGAGRGSSKQKSKQAEKLTREEKAVAKYLYNNLDSKKATMYGNHKLYFSGAKAVTCLMESKFASPTSKDHLFSSRKLIVEFCQRLISKDAFHHVLKTVKRQKPRSTKSSKDENTISTTSKKSKEEAQVTDSKTLGQSAKSKKTTKSKSPDPKESGDAASKEVKSEDSRKDNESTLRNRKNKEISEKENEGESESKETTSNRNKDFKSDKKATSEQSKDKSPVKKKTRAKVSLDLHPNQTFYDDPKEYYVWVFEVTSVWKWLIGGGLIVGSIAICLFPLWPESLRHLAWYATSSVAMGLLGLIFGLALIRLFVYGIVFAATFGKCRYWLFPNLFAEVGFLESFVPIHESKWIDSKESKSKKKKDKTSDDENEAGQDTEESEDNGGAANSMDEQEDEEGEAGKHCEEGDRESEDGDGKENISDSNYIQDRDENAKHSCEHENKKGIENDGDGKLLTESNSAQEENGFEIVNVEKGQNQM